MEKTTEEETTGVDKKIVAYLAVDFDGKDQRTYKSLKLIVGTHTFDFKSGDPVVDWIYYITFLAENFATLGLKRVDHDFSVEKFIQCGDYIMLAYFDRTTGMKVPFAELVTYPMPEWNKLFERYIIRDKIDTLEDLKKYYEAKAPKK